MNATGTDSRQLLNRVLAYYYERGTTIYLVMEARHGSIQLSDRDANAAYATLLRDGHIEQVTPPQNFPVFPIASITAQGRVFHEQGGYRDERTYLDRLLDKAKNRPVLVWIYLIASALAVAVSILAVIGIFKTCP